MMYLNDYIARLPEGDPFGNEKAYILKRDYMDYEVKTFPKDELSARKYIEEQFDYEWSDHMKWFQSSLDWYGDGWRMTNSYCEDCLRPIWKNEDEVYQCDCENEKD